MQGNSKFITWMSKDDISYKLLMPITVIGLPKLGYFWGYGKESGKIGQVTGCDGGMNKGNCSCGVRSR